MTAPLPYPPRLVYSADREIDLADLRPHPQLEADWRWMFQLADGEMGLRSSFPGMVLKIQCPGPAPSPQLREMDERQVAAASRARPIRRALELAGKRHSDILRAAYGELPAELRPLEPGYGALAGVVTSTSSARAAHRRSRTKRPLIDWLERLAKRTKASGEARVTHAAVTREAEMLLVEAGRAYGWAVKQRERQGRAERPEQFHDFQFRSDRG